MNYEFQTPLISLALISLVLGIYPLPNGVVNTGVSPRVANVAYAKTETITNLGESTKLAINAGYNVPQYITRFNRRTHTQELVRVPMEMGEAICSKDWPCGQALRVASCESDFRQDAKSKTRDIGIFQINPIHGYSVFYLSDLRNNISVAYKLYSRSKNWSAWYSSYRCHKLI